MKLRNQERALAGPRRIILLAHNLCSAGGLSIGRNITATLPKIAPMHRYLMVVPKGYDYAECNENENVEVLECPKMDLYRRHFWERTVLRHAMAKFAPDWIWAIGNVAVTSPPCKQSLLLHNSNRVYKVVSTQTVSLRARVFKWMSNRQLRHSLRGVSRLYCQTESMRNRSHQVLRYPLHQIGLCPNAFTLSIPRRKCWPAELETLRAKFILFVLAKYYRHKNLEIIVETFSRYRAELEGVACVLTIDRNQGTGAARLIDRLHAEGLEERILCVGAIPQERLGEFFHAADTMFLPTLLESFSGTYLEAMELDTPILTSDRDFAREVCGNAAVYVDQHSPLSVKDAIVCLRDNCALRNQLVANGRERLRRHLKTWPDILRCVLRQESIEYG